MNNETKYVYLTRFLVTNYCTIIIVPIACRSWREMKRVSTAVTNRQQVERQGRRLRLDEHGRWWVATFADVNLALDPSPFTNHNVLRDWILTTATKLARPIRRKCPRNRSFLMLELSCAEDKAALTSHSKKNQWYLCILYDVYLTYLIVKAVNVHFSRKNNDKTNVNV